MSEELQATKLAELQEISNATTDATISTSAASDGPEAHTAPTAPRAAAAATETSAKRSFDRRGKKAQRQEQQDSKKVKRVARDYSANDWVPPDVKEERRPKRKVAVLFGYCGTGYHGLQANPPMKTIEGDLFAAFVKAGGVSQSNSVDPKKVSFQRAARTDKGVHAAGNCISLKMIVEDEDIVEKINENLPDQIRVWGIIRTAKGFESRKSCSSRMYEYLIPSYAFLPPNPESILAKKVAAAKQEFPGQTRDDPEGEEWWKRVTAELEAQGLSANMKELYEAEVALEAPEGFKQNDGGATKETISRISPELQEKIRQAKQIQNAARRAYRITPERLELIRKAFKIYEGTHRFHNFTVRMESKDPSCMRVMKSLVVSDPKIIAGTEWLSIKIHGQSFMLHQIRKMVGMAALVVRTGCPLDRITEAFEPKRINVPKAPSLGLLLEQPIYDSYNRKLVDLGRDPISFDAYAEQMEAFKFKHIYDKIYDEEAKQNVFHGFFAFIDSYNGDGFLDFLTARGMTDNTVVAADENDSSDVNSDNEG